MKYNPSASLLLLGLACALVSLPASAKNGTKSGVVGQAFISYNSCASHFGTMLSSCAQPVQRTVTVLVYEKGQLVAAVDSDDQGSFEINLKPGDYVLAPYVPPLDPDSFRVGSVEPAFTWVTVTKKSFTPTYILMLYSHF
jgi:hypothetical protein